MLEKKTKRFKPAPVLSCESKSGGSALIMTIVLTSLLAIVAVMFVAVARMDRASTSNIADNKTLDLAARSITEIINKELINDTPGAAGHDPNNYYDYPDTNNPWLASIEPYQDKTDPNIYRWRQISDVTGYLARRNFDCNDVSVQPYGIPHSPKVIHDNPIYLDTNGNLEKQSADADGDGIADSWWIELEDPNWSMRSSKGQRIYAAVRVIDNGGMVNINTAHSFDANTADGNSQMQINLQGLLKGTDTIAKLHQARCGIEPNSWSSYEKKVIWDYNNVPGGSYLPFDISDELELRYRYCIDSKFVSRFETNLPQTADAYGDPGGLYDGGGGWGLGYWKIRITDSDDPNTDRDRRHMLTTYNYDRVITPSGDKMTNINYADVNSLYTAVRRGLINADGNFPDVNKVSAQIAVNIFDYRDNDSNVTVFPKDSNDYYGFETPCIYISELACRVGKDSNDPNRSYAIELFKPYAEDSDPNGSWNVIIDNGATTTIPISAWSGSSQYYVIRWNNLNVPLDINSGTPFQSTDNTTSNTIVFDANSKILLTRDVKGIPVVVDSVEIPGTWSPAPSPVADGNHCVRRDINPPKCIRRLWNLTDSNSVTLGRFNSYTTAADANTIQAHPADSNFTNVGQIGMIFRKPAYYRLVDSNTGVIGYSGVDKFESAVRLNLADPNYQQIFKYLTVWPPSKYVSDSTETRVKGRININTAPAFVIAQLPWVSRDVNDSNLAKAIVAYRDKRAITSGPDYYHGGVSNSRQLETGKSNISEANGFRSIGELMNVINNSGNGDYDIRYYGLDTQDQKKYPDLDPNDGVPDDFEERDLIFARISDLVTVRSDVFTAYILVRVCTNVKIDGSQRLVEGPQKRYMVIFDRSSVPLDPNAPYIKAFQSVPEAR